MLACWQPVAGMPASSAAWSRLTPTALTPLKPCLPAPVTCSSRCWDAACVELESVSGALLNSQVRLSLLQSLSLSLSVSGAQQQAPHLGSLLFNKVRHVFAIQPVVDCSNVAATSQSGLLKSLWQQNWLTDVWGQGVCG